ncbi:MAG: cyanoglobin [Myxococcales bacterium]|nr:cyanoglobin [Myxococcales bacterium]
MTDETPYGLLGGRERVLAIVTAFYDAMERDEPELTALHDCPTPGRVSPGTRERFGLFLVGWLGGPQEYMERHGHPRLRMRHARVPIDVAMRDAWLRCMSTALDHCAVEGPVRGFLDQRFAEVADFLRNRAE